MFDIYQSVLQIYTTLVQDYAVIYHPFFNNHVIILCQCFLPSSFTNGCCLKNYSPVNKSIRYGLGFNLNLSILSNMSIFVAFLDVRAHACENNNSKEAEGRKRRQNDGGTKSDLHRNSVRLFKISTESRRIVPERSKNQDGGRCCDPQTNSVRLFKSTITENRGKILLVQTKRKHDEGTN